MEIQDYHPNSVIHRMQISNQLNNQRNQQGFDTSKHQYVQGGSFAMPSIPIRLTGTPNNQREHSAQKQWCYSKELHPEVMHRVPTRVQESPGLQEFISKTRKPSSNEMMRGHSSFKMTPDVSPRCESKPTKTTGVGSSSAFKPYGNTSCSPAEHGYSLHSTHPYFNISDQNEEIYTHYRDVQSVQPFQLHASF